MCICIDTYIYVYTYAYIRMHIYLYKHMYIYIYMCVQLLQALPLFVVWRSRSNATSRRCHQHFDLVPPVGAHSTSLGLLGTSLWPCRRLARGSWHTRHSRWVRCENILTLPCRCIHRVRQTFWRPTYASVPWHFARGSPEGFDVHSTPGVKGVRIYIGHAV